MEDLRMLLEAENTIKERIGEALAELKKWFKDKMAMVKERIRGLRGKKGAGEAVDALNDVIDDCRDGLDAVADGDAAEARNCKERVIKGLKVAAAAVAAIGAAAGVAVHRKDIKNIADEKVHDAKVAIHDMGAKGRAKKAEKRAMDHAKKIYGEEVEIEENVELEEDFEVVFTLEEELILTEGVKEALKAIGDWFREKKAMVKRKLQEIGGKGEAKEAFNDALAGCDEGMRAVQARDAEKANACKERVIKALKIGAAALAAVGAGVAAKKGKDAIVQKGNEKRKARAEAELRGEEAEIELEEAFEILDNALDLLDDEE